MASVLSLSATLTVSLSAPVAAGDPRPSTSQGAATERAAAVRVDVRPGWHWVVSSRKGCRISTTSDTASTSWSATYKKADLFLVPRDAKTVRVEGCTTFTHVDKLRKRPRQTLRVEGAYLLGRHLAKGTTYRGKPRVSSGTCRWQTFRSPQAYDRHLGFPKRKGSLTVTRKTKVVVVSSGCVWKRTSNR